jgi:hypothetical protein
VKRVVLIVFFKKTKITRFTILANVKNISCFGTKQLSIA